MTSILSKTSGLLAALLLIFLGFSTANASGPDKTDEEKDIVEVAISADNFSTLVAAVKAAGLVETLQGDGPFTVFAPTDEAFAALPEGTVEKLLKPENKELLVAILTYHVVPGEVTASEVVHLDSAPTVQGAVLDVTVEDDGVMINDATVIATDIDASNGVIHVIDAVLLPPTH